MSEATTSSAGSMRRWLIIGGVVVVIALLLWWWHALEVVLQAADIQQSFCGRFRRILFALQLLAYSAPCSLQSMLESYEQTDHCCAVIALSVAKRQARA